MRNVERRERGARDLYQAAEGLRLIATFWDYITEDDILAFDGDPTQLEMHVKALAFERQLSGQVTGRTVAEAAKQATTANAAVSAVGRQDLGGSPPAVQTQGVNKGMGVDAMAANVRLLFSEGPNLPAEIVF